MCISRPVIFITISYILIILSFVFCRSIFTPNDANFKDKKIEATGVVYDEPQVGAGVQTFLLKINFIKNKEQYLPSKIILKTSFFSSDKKIAYGDLLKIKGVIGHAKENTNPYEFDYQNYLERHEISGILKIMRKEDLIILRKDNGNPIIALSLKIKNKISKLYTEIIPDKYCALLGSMIFGLKAFPIPDDMKERYQKSGVLHILVASGQQVSLLIVVCMAIGKLIKFKSIMTFLVTSSMIWIFTLMAGSGSSIVRAAIMGQIIILGSIIGRENDFYNSFAISALILLLINPYNILDIGFQLSYIATWSLVYLAPMLQKLFSSYMPQGIAGALAISLGPVCTTTPLSIYYFSSFTFVAVLANIMVVPLAELVTIFGFIFTIIGLINIFLAKLFGAAVLLVLISLDNIVCFLSYVPGMYRHIKSPDFIFILLYFAGLIYITERIKRGELRGFLLRKGKYFILTVIFLLIWNSYAALFAQKEFIATFLDVGQGDSIFLEMPDGKNCLIDGGKRNNIVVPFLIKKGINTLDMVILTHPHEDHLGGLIKVLENFKINEVLDSGQDTASGSYRRFMELIERNKIKYNIGRAGQVLNFGDVKGYVLAPYGEFIKGTMSDLNNNSIVTKFVYGASKMLLMGDAGFDEESEIISHVADLKCDLLKVGHHGSATSTGDDFLDYAAPKYAIISVGAFNKYNHPNFETLKRLQNSAVKIYRTDKNGAVVARSDGIHLDIETMRH